MSNLVIVAIPDENDRVWKVSSDKVPHLTLLYLGASDEVSNLESIIQFVEHAASTTLRRFYLPVDRRGELGADQADVLFFKKGRYDYKAVRDFRSFLLKDNNIRTAYDSATQFEGPWMPHLTLGYPAAPAKPDPSDRDYGFYDVCFNKIAVWTDDFDGPEYLLKDYWDEYEALESVPLDVAMSGIVRHGADPDEQRRELAAAFLAHHGVKGMRWGVRKEELPGGGNIRISNRTNVAAVSTRSQALIVAAGPLAFASPRFRAENKAVGAHNKQRAADKKDAKKDAKWEKKIYTTESAVAVHNAMADHFNSRIGAINDKPKYKNLNLFEKPNDPISKEYTKEVDALTHEGYKAAVKQVHGASPSGKKQAQLSEDGQSIKIVDADVKHAVVDGEDVEFLLRRDDNDLILEMNKAELSSAKHTSEIGADFLEHFGVKGMHWGVRKADLSAVGKAAKSVGNAAKSTAGKVGKAASAVGKFAGDVNFENRVTTEEGHAAVQRVIQAKAKTALKRTDLPTIKAKPEYQKAKKLPNRLRHPFDPATKAYRKEVKEAYIKRLEDAANTMTNPSGTRQYTVRERGWELPAEGGALPRSKNYWSVTSRAIKHAAGDGDVTTWLELVMDDDGFITDLKDLDSEPIEPTLAQSTIEAGAEFLEHYGVKGMHWGVRRAREAPTAVDPTAMSKVPHGAKRKTKIEVAGGENHPAHDDAIAVAEARAKLKKSGVAALSNAELQKMQKRLNLEAQVAQLTSSRGSKFIQRQLEQQGQQTVQTGFRKGGSHVVKKVAKKGARSAAVAALL